MGIKGFLSLLQLLCLTIMVILYVRNIYKKVFNKNERINKSDNKIIEAEVIEKEK